MAMQSGNALLSDKMQYPGGGSGTGGGAGGGGEGMHHHRGWFPDERDGFISWLRGEFAASNAIIDSLCHHLRVIGAPGEYDGVIGCIQQRRCNWNPVLHMQQYFSVAEVMYALQQVTWRRQQRFLEPVKVPVKEFRRSGGVFGGRQGQQRGDGVMEGQNSNLETHNHEKISNGSEKEERVYEKGEEDLSDDKGVASSEEKKGSCFIHHDGEAHSTLEKQNSSTIVPKTFVANEIYEGKAINAVDGMKLYENLIDDSEVPKFVALINDLRAAGRKGQFQGQAFVVSKRPMRGHGREMIQLGFPLVDVPPEYEVTAGTSKDRKIDPIPGMLQHFIERLISMQVVDVKPDSCIIDIFNEGDHSQPHMWPHWFGRPICMLFLTECDMNFGRVIVAEHPGYFRGSLKLSLSPGSLLVMQGRSADFSKHAIPSLRKQRILLTLTKSLPNKTTVGDGQQLPSAGVAPSSHWVPPPSRSPNHVRHPVGPKHYGPVSTSGVLPAPPAHPQLTPNGIQPIFLPAPVAPAMPYPAPVALPPASAGWPAAPRHPPPRLLNPGTGVFLPPPGSDNSSGQSLSSAIEAESSSMETPSLSGKDNFPGIPNGNSITYETVADSKGQQKECNGSMDGTGDYNKMASMEEQQQQQSDDVLVAGKPGEAVLG